MVLNTVLFTHKVFTSMQIIASAENHIYVAQASEKGIYEKAEQNIQSWGPPGCRRIIERDRAESGLCLI